MRQNNFTLSLMTFFYHLGMWLHLTNQIHSQFLAGISNLKTSLKLGSQQVCLNRSKNSLIIQLPEDSRRLSKGRCQSHLNQEKQSPWRRKRIIPPKRGPLPRMSSRSPSTRGQLLSLCDVLYVMWWWCAPWEGNGMDCTVQQKGPDGVVKLFQIEAHPIVKLS